MTLLNSKKLSIGIASMAAVGLAVALHYGSYLCENCSSPPNESQIAQMVKSTINKHVPMWRKNDTVDICNGTTCTTLALINVNPMMWKDEASYSDPRSGYKDTGYVASGNAPPEGGGGGGGTGVPPVAGGGGGGGGVVIVEPTFSCDNPSSSWEYIHWCVGV